MAAAPRVLPVERFTVIHGGARIDAGTSRALVEAAHSWSLAAERGVTRVVEVWASPWSWFLPSCQAVSVAAGGPIWTVSVPVADDLVADLRAIGVRVRHRRARQSQVDQAELRAVCQGWPVRYL